MKNKLYRIEGTNFSFWLMHVYKVCVFYWQDVYIFEIQKERLLNLKIILIHLGCQIENKLHEFRHIQE